MAGARQKVVVEAEFKIVPGCGGHKRGACEGASGIMLLVIRKKKRSLDFFRSDEPAKNKPAVCVGVRYEEAMI